MELSEGISLPKKDLSESAHKLLETVFSDEESSKSGSEEVTDVPLLNPPKVCEAHLLYPPLVDGAHEVKEFLTDNEIEDTGQFRISSSEEMVLFKKLNAQGPRINSLKESRKI